MLALATNPCFGDPLPKSTSSSQSTLSRTFGMRFVSVNKQFKGVKGYNGGVKAISKEIYCSLETIKKNIAKWLWGRSVSEFWHKGFF